MDSEVFDKGLKLRSRIMGEAYTKAAFVSPNPNDRAVQELVTEYGYGAVWSRPGLPLQFRSMLTVALLASLNRPDELRQHIRGALNIGVTRDQIFEVLLHVMPYCGAPASLGGLKIAKEAFADYDAQQGAPQNP